jgi:hypothetical protein
MATTIDTPRQGLKAGAMNVRTVPIKKHHLKSMLGPKGEHITKLEEEFDVQVAIEKEMLPEGFVAVNLYHQDLAQLDSAEQKVLQWTMELTPGTLYDAVVSDVRDFGAYVLIDGSHQAFIHMSEVQEVRLSDKEIHDVLKPGDGFKVLCLSSDERGIRVSRKAAFRHLGLDNTGTPVNLKGLTLPSYEELEGNRRDHNKAATRKAATTPDLSLAALDAAETLGSTAAKDRAGGSKAGAGAAGTTPAVAIHPAAAAAAERDTAAWEAAVNAATAASSSAEPGTMQASEKTGEATMPAWNESQASHVVYTRGQPLNSQAKVDRQTYNRPGPRQTGESETSSFASPLVTCSSTAARKPATIGEGVTGSSAGNATGQTASEGSSSSNSGGDAANESTAASLAQAVAEAEAEGDARATWASRRENTTTTTNTNNTNTNKNVKKASSGSTSSSSSSSKSAMRRKGARKTPAASTAPKTGAAPEVS